jgi:hypothetical protein
MILHISSHNVLRKGLLLSARKKPGFHRAFPPFLRGFADRFLFFHACLGKPERLSELVWARCRFSAATNAFTAFDHIVNLHAAHKACDPCRISAAAVHKLNRPDGVAIQIDNDLG